MGATHSQSNEGPQLPDNIKEKPARYSYMERRLLKKYMPSFPYTEKSTERHRQIGGKHWETVFGNGNKSKANAQGEARGKGHLSERTNNKITELYDIFYQYLEENGSELKNIFRSSMHVRGRVLVHISAGTRAMLGAVNMIDKVISLTKTHRRFGVKPQHFDLVGRALLFAMEKTSGPSNWSNEISEAWRIMFTHISLILIRHQLKGEKKHEEGVIKAAKEKERLMGSLVNASVVGMEPAAQYQQQQQQKRTFQFQFHLHVPSIRSRSSVRDCSSATTARSVISHKTTARSGHFD